MQLKPVKSSNIKAVGFEDGQLEVEFHSGKRYRYAATKDEFETMIKTDSIGSYFSRVIRPRPALEVTDED